jgi:hypothetical protein
MRDPDRPTHLLRTLSSKVGTEQHIASEAKSQARAGDALLLPIALAACWTFANKVGP